MNLNQRAAACCCTSPHCPGPHGIGDFGPEAYHFVDWLAARPALWQWLPTNPIGPGDSPYQSVSAFAGSPLMVALEPLVAARLARRAPAARGGFDAVRGRLRAWCPGAWRAARGCGPGFVPRGDRRPSAPRSPPGATAQATGWTTTRCSWRWKRAQAAQPWWDWAPPLRAAMPPRWPRRARSMPRDRLLAFVQWCFDRAVPR
jgi:4-alpha-glucanotransferase